MSFLKIKLLIVSVIMLAASSAFASSSSYEVQMDTSSLLGTSAYLYLQYTPVNGVASTATISNFATDGLLGAQDTLDVGNGTAVAGTLPGTVVFGNTNGVNDYNHAITLGSIVDFLVTTSNVADSSTGTGSSTFSVGLFGNAAGTVALLNVNDPNVAGTALVINQLDNGTTSAVSLDSTTSATPTPLPAAAWLLGSGIMGLAGIRKRKNA